MLAMKKTVHLQTQNKTNKIPRVKRANGARIALFLPRTPKVTKSQGSGEEAASRFLGLILIALLVVRLW
jgi:hypothetical protein